MLFESGECLLVLDVVIVANLLEFLLLLGVLLVEELLL